MRFTGVVTSSRPSRVVSLFHSSLLLIIAMAASCAHGGPGAAGGGAGQPAASAAPDGPATPAVQPPAVGVDGATRFLEQIPRCASLPQTLTARDAREQPEGTRVAVRGVLVHNPKWDCPAKGCGGKAAGGARRASGGCCNTCRTRWFVVDAADAARPYMSRARLYLRGAGQPELASLEAEDCDVAKVNAATPPKPVVLIGTFRGSAGEGGGSQLIESAELCAPP